MVLLSSNSNEFENVLNLPDHLEPRSKVQTQTTFAMGVSVTLV